MANKQIISEIIDDLAVFIGENGSQSPYYTLKSCKYDKDTTLNLVIQVCKEDSCYSIYTVAEIDGGDDISDPEFYYNNSIEDGLNKIYNFWTNKKLKETYAEYRRDK